MKTMEIELEQAVTPDRILETAMGFWPSKTLLAAVKLGLFKELSEGPLPASALRQRLNLHQRSSLDFFDALVALGFLRRVGMGWTALYANTPETALFLNPGTPAYVGGLLEMANDRLYPFWSDLELALQTGLPQNEVKRTGKPLFEALYACTSSLEKLMEGMAGAQTGNFTALAELFNFSRYSSLCDIGGANAMLSICVALHHPHIECLSLDLPPVQSIAHRNIEKFGLSDRVHTDNLDFVSQEFPKAEIITMGNILHDWNLEQKKLLISKAYRALPVDGALIVVENIIDDERRHNVFGLLSSLNMAIETEGGFDYSYVDFNQWALEAGFRTTSKLPLLGPSSAVIAYK